MNIIYGILGGDKRNIKLAQLLAKENDMLYTYGLEKAEEINNIENIKKCNTFEEMVEKANCIIGPIPFTKDNTNVNMPYCEKNVAIYDCVKNIEKMTLLTGQIPKEIEEMAGKDIKIVDLMKNEELTIFNTIATAEGTIQVLMENTDKILQGMKVLVLGFGRVAKVVARKLEGLQMDLTCAARRSSDLAWIETYGYLSENIYDLKELSKYDVIINTVPSLIIGENQLEKVKKDVIIIELASYPGGIDFEKAKERNIKVISAMGLPGKVAPESSALYVKRAVSNILKEIY